MDNPFKEVKEHLVDPVAGIPKVIAGEIEKQVTHIKAHVRRAVLREIYGELKKVCEARLDAIAIEEQVEDQKEVKS